VQACAFPNLVSGYGPRCTDSYRRTAFRDDIKAATLRRLRIHDLRHTDRWVRLRAPPVR
jgi:hypothetical protein